MTRPLTSFAAGVVFGVLVHELFQQPRRVALGDHELGEDILDCGDVVGKVRAFSDAFVDAQDCHDVALDHLKAGQQFARCHGPHATDAAVAAGAK